MSTYIFYTDEGYTIAPNNEELESLQVLGIEDGETKEEALANLYKNNKWIEENNFSELKMRCYAILNPEILEDIKTIVRYLWEDESKHWEENECPDIHIFKVLKRIQEKF